MYASSVDQRHLLDLADVDQQIRQARHRGKSLPEHAALAELSARHQQLREEHQQAGVALEGIDQEVATLTERADALRAQIASGTGKLNSGEGLTSRDLVALQHEIDGLGGLLEEAEGEELDAMERQEAASARYRDVGSEAEAVAAEGKRTLAARDAAAAEVSATVAGLESTAAGYAGALEAENSQLLGAYRRAFDEGGLGAAELKGSTCPSCGQTFGSVALSVLRSADGSEVATCEECDTLLVPPAS